MSNNKKQFQILSPPNFSATFIYVFNDQITKSLYAIHQEDGLLKYNHHTNKWINHGNFSAIDSIHKYECLPRSFFQNDTSLAVIDSSNNTIYLINLARKIATLRLNDNKNERWEIINAPSIGPGAQACMITNKYHIIGGWSNNKHITYTEGTQKFNIMHDFDRMKGFKMSYHQLVRLKNELLLFGGLDMSDTALRTVYEYSITNNVWNKLDTKVPSLLSLFGGTAIFRDQFIILFGGEKKGVPINDIWIYCVKNQSFKKSNIKCPFKGQCQAFTYNDDRKDELTIFGYFRAKWSKCGMANHLFPPTYLIKIVNKYYLNQWIHLLFIKWNNFHWKIDIYDILCDID